MELPVLEVTNLRVIRGSTAILRGVNWRVGAGDWTAWRALDSLAAGSILAGPDESVQTQLRVTDRAGHVTVASTGVEGGWSHP